VTIHIRVKLYGTLRRFSRPETPGLWPGDVPQGTCIEDLLHLLGTSSAEVSNAAIDGQVVPFKTPIPDGAEVTLVTPVGGGSL
jgi:molybdopterin converting factor small subunit